jgi:transposase
MEEQYRIYVGIDWASQAHQACVLNCEGRILAERSFAHSGQAIVEFAQWLSELAGGEPGQVAVAIELTHGAVVETLIERGFHVYAINPKQLDRFRDRYSPAGAKDDRRDALVLGDSLRTDRARFRRLRLDHPLVIKLREVSRMHEELVRECNQLANRLREQLHRFYVQALELCPAANEPWLWALLELAPSPSVAQRLRPQRVQRVLRQHRIRRLSAKEVVAVLRTPALKVAPGVVEAASEHIALLLPRLRLAHSQHQRCGTRLEALLDELQSADDELEGGDDEHHRRPAPSDIEIVRSLPAVGKVIASTMVAEASDALAERDYQALRTNGGVAPVTRQSGKHRVVLMRYACNSRLRHALYHWARVAVSCDAASKPYYAALRRRGCSHGRALRAVADRLLRILIAMLKSGTLFDPSRARLSQADSTSHQITENVA